MSIADRKIYEDGGWNDGRLGQAYDLIADVLREQREPRPHRNSLLIEIEKLDEAQTGDAA